MLQILPNTIKKLGISRLGPLEMEHRHQTQNYEVAKKIDDIDRENRENLWEMTEDVFSRLADASAIRCDAVVGYILQGVSSPIRTMVMLNHIAPKLVKDKEDITVSRIKRGILKSIRTTKRLATAEGCPVFSDVDAIDINRYDEVVHEWIRMARFITSSACKNKVEVYSAAIDETKDKFWKNVYITCIKKNKLYIQGMGYDL